MAERFAVRHWRQDPLSALLPLRAFLGVVFLYAGLSKIADRTFLDDSSPLSMHASVVAVKSASPIGSLLGPVVDHSAVFGIVMALGEIAVGIGTIAGLFHRIAAVGGIVLSLSLFLTVSWGADPWYTGADIGYALAFTPLLLSRATPWAADAWLAASNRQRTAADTRLRATPVDRTRRAILTGIAAGAGLIAVAGAALARGTSKVTAGGGVPAAGPTPASAFTPSTAASPPASSTGATTLAPAGTSTAAPGSAATTAPTAGGRTSAARTSAAAKEVLAQAADVPVGGAKQVDDPVTGKPVWVLQLSAGKYTALDAACPHQGCAVTFESASSGFVCPCHRSTFTAAGVVQHGPAATNLVPVPISESAGVITLS